MADQPQHEIVTLRRLLCGLIGDRRTFHAIEGMPHDSQAVFDYQLEVENGPVRSARLIGKNDGNTVIRLE